MGNNTCGKGIGAGRLRPACVLAVGHGGDCKPGGTCYKHGPYVSENWNGGAPQCPQWPSCVELPLGGTSTVAITNQHPTPEVTEEHRRKAILQGPTETIWDALQRNYRELLDAREALEKAQAKFKAHELELANVLEMYREHAEKVEQEQERDQAQPVQVGDRNTCICGKPIWGEGWNPSTGQLFFSHTDDNEERHADGSWVRPAKYSDWFKEPRNWRERCDDLKRAEAAESALSAMKERIREIAGECDAFPASAIKWRLMKVVEAALTSSTSGEKEGNDEQ